MRDDMRKGDPAIEPDVGAGDYDPCVSCGRINAEHGPGQCRPFELVTDGRTYTRPTSPAKPALRGKLVMP